MKLESTNGEPVFLAMTALEEFWDTSGKIVFLGRWCCRYSRRQYWESLQYMILPAYWSDHQRQNSAYMYVQRIYELLLSRLAATLNILHHVQYGLQYWRILLGPWLLQYLFVLYDRYVSLQYAETFCKEFITVGLAESEFVTPQDTEHFIVLLKRDVFNLQIYTTVLEMIQGSVPRRKARKVYDTNGQSSEFVKDVKRVTKQLFTITLLSGKTTPVFLKNSYFSSRTELQLTAMSRGKIRGLNTIGSVQCENAVDSSLRKRLVELVHLEGHFETLATKALEIYLPICFLEGYKQVVEYSAVYPKHPKVIFSANAWYMDEAFKHWASSSAESGTLLVGAQHGGNYGSVQYFKNTDHEIAITQRYYSWGWTERAYKEKIIPFSGTKFTGRKAIGADNSRNGIVFVTTLLQRYLTEFSGMPLLADQFHEYLQWQIEFAQKLSAIRQRDLLVRLHFEDGGWDIQQRWKDALPHVKIDTWKVPFAKRLKRCRLYVCDHLSTTFTEALSANKPTILFWKPEDYLLREEAQPYYDALRTAGILFDTPQAAADAVNTVYDDVEGWWSAPIRQTVRKEFCEQFARSSPDALNAWIQEFKTMLAQQAATTSQTA